LGLCALGAAHCAVKNQASLPGSETGATSDAGQKPPAREITVPSGFVIEHFGDAPDLRAVIKVLDPELDSLWQNGSLITLRRNGSRCAYARLGAEIHPLRPCEQALGGDAGSTTLALESRRFGVPLSQGAVILERVKGSDTVIVPRAWLTAWLAPLGLPVLATADPVPLRVFASEEGRGFALEWVIAEDALAALGRFDLTRRYGGFADYVSDVRAWGDGSKFQWILRLDGGGVGLRLVGRTLRLAVQSGSDWQQALDQLLGRPNLAAASLPVLQIDGLALRLDPAGTLRPMAVKNPLPTTPLLRQLAARLQRWLAKPKEAD